MLICLHILNVPLKKQIYVVTAIDLNRTKVFLCVLYNFDRCILIFFLQNLYQIGAKHCQTQYIRSSVPNQGVPIMNTQGSFKTT